MMKKAMLQLLLLLAALPLPAQDFESCFLQKTLRVDYTFSGDARRQSVSIDALSSLPYWAGRRQRLAELPLEGNGQIIVREIPDGTVIYRTSFSSLFQEWLTTGEAQTTARAFENTFLLPFPKRPVEVEVRLLDSRRRVTASLTHRVDPDDILIRPKGSTHVMPHRNLLKNGSERECIDIAILAEGYTEQEAETFYDDAAAACESLFAHEPFRSMKECFNVVAAAVPSRDSGVAVPRLGEWKDTAFGAHFSTFYSDRYLTTMHVKALHDALAGIPYEHIIILANTGEYGGGGIYNAYTLTAAHHPLFRPVVVHEFGHSFGGLADEYFYENDDLTVACYPTDMEPWEPNLTSLTDFSSKWENLLTPATPVPTPPADAGRYPVGVYEGGGGLLRGIYRPADNCRMRTNGWPAFCPVCQRSLRRLIAFYTDTEPEP